MVLEIPFRMRGVQGRVHVTVGATTAPAELGCPPETAGFPACRAKVDYPFRGYESLMGWVQLVRSDDNASGGERFEIDPLACFGDLPHPFCWLGLNPDLFDVPSRPKDENLDWLAYSFLCVPDDIGEGPEVRAVLGFSWGFTLADGQVQIVAPTVLDPGAWEAQLPDLSHLYSDWRFPSGFTDLADQAPPDTAPSP